MRKKTILNITIVITILMAISFNIYHTKKETAAWTIEDTELQQMVLEADSFKKREEPFLYYKLYSGSRSIGYCLNTKDVVPDEKGYGGPLDILVWLDEIGNIKDLKVLRHNETPKYASGITESDFLGQFKGKGPDDKFIVGEDVDAITHATISTRSVANILKSSLVRMQAIISPSSRFASPKKEELRPWISNLDMDFYLTVLIITFLLIAYYLRVSWLRYSGLCVSIIYFGFIKANFISMSNLGSIFLWNLPDLELNVTWYVFIFSSIGLSVLLSKFYCSYMCPFGGVQIFLNKIFKFNMTLTPIVAIRLRKIRYALLWILTMLVLLLNNPNNVNYEPFSTAFLMRGSVVAWSIAVVILVMSLFYHRPFCDFFCAAGGFLDILSSWGRRIFRRT